MSLPQSARRNRRKNRFPISLNRQLDHKLFGYAAAASAAGVGVMAMAAPCLAKIVYTPTHQTIGPGQSLTISLNNNGVTDFTIGNETSLCDTGPDCRLQSLVVTPAAQNRVWTTYGGRSFAWALAPDRKVGAGDQFGSGFIRMDRCKATRTSFYLSGSWADNKNRYLGLEFSVNGKTYYGWARFTVLVSAHCGAKATLTGYAYENTPGEPIPTGRTGSGDVSAAERPQATLGALALGSAGLVAWRRDEE
jgi:hypothetical protein